MNSNYQIRLLLPEDRNSVEDLYRAVYGQVWREKTNLRWTLDQPLITGGAALAVEGDKVVSAQAYCDFPLHTPWGDSRATLFLDVATHPAHQRRGLFRRVVAAARAAAFDRGVPLIITTPNRLSLPGFQTMPEWVQLCSLDCLFLPLGAGSAIPGDDGLIPFGARMALATASLFWKGPPAPAKRLAQTRYVIESPWSPDTDADDLWSRTVAPTDVMVARNRAFLYWRFGPEYRLFLARSPQGPVGYAAARMLNRGGLRIGMVLDCMVADEMVAPSLFASVVAWLREQGASAIIGYFLRGSTPWRLARAAGFLLLWRPLLPRDYPVCASVRPEDPHGAELLNVSCWHISLADSDLA